MNILENKFLNWQAWLFIFLIFILSFFTYFFNYSQPQFGFWDEGYHIASAQKYFNGVFFMEQHPPLGKLLIALGEKIFFPKGQQGENGFYENLFTSTDQAKNYPKDFSFAGYRFFSALFAWLAAPLIFLVFLLITKNSFYSAVFSCLYIFDNALIVHSRGAMLEGPLIFFVILMILMFFLLLEFRDKNKKVFYVLSLCFGASFGFIATTKILGLAMIFLLPALGFVFFPDWKKITKLAFLFLTGFLIVYISVWQIHFLLGKKIEQNLPDKGFYGASAGYKKIISKGQTGNIFNFPVMISDSIKYVSSYNKGVPKLDVLNPKENGSPFYLWPLGARAINYRWDQVSDGVYKYLYLQSNPVVWMLCLLAIITGLSISIASIFFDLHLKNKYILLLFLGIYFAYMVAISLITRVLYLYSYFIPLILSFIILSIVFLELDRFIKWKISDRGKNIILAIFFCLIFLSFIFYSPLTYHKKLTDKEFGRRNILPIWDLKCVKCPD